MTLYALSGWAQGLASSQPEVLVPGRSYRFDVPAQTEKEFSLTLSAGQFCDISIEQIESLTEVVVTEPDGTVQTVRAYDAGKASIIHIPMVAEADGTYALKIRPYHKQEAVTGVVTVGELRPASSAHSEQALEEYEWAKAEWVRRKGDKNSWPAALEEYEQVAAFAHKQNEEALRRRALTGKARLELFQLNDYVAAREAALEAVNVPDTPEDVPGEALAWKTLGSAYYYVADYSHCIDAYKHALPLYEKNQDLYWQGIILGNLAYLYRETGDTDAALESSQKALEIARSLKDWFGVDFNLEALGAIHLSRGEMERAFELYHEALDSLRVHPYPEEAAATWNGLGELYAQLEDEPRAEESFRKALPLSQEAHDTAGELKVLFNLGNLALRARPSVAAEYYLQGLKTAERLQLPREESFLLTGLGQSYARQGKRTEAIASLQKALSIAQRISQRDSQAHAWQSIGDFYAGTDDPAKAKEAYFQAYDLWTAESNRAQAAIAQASEARLEFAAKDLTHARKDIESAITLIETSRSTLASYDLRTSYFASKHSYYDLAISILMRLDRAHPGDGYDLEAFSMAERARSRTLLDTLSGGGALLGKVSSELASQQRRNREQLDAAYERYRTMAADPKTTSSSFRQVRGEIEKLLRESDELEARMRANSPIYAALTAAQPVTSQQVQDQILSAHTVVLSYWVGERESYCWEIRRDRVTTRRLPSQEMMAEMVQHYRHALLARTDFPDGESVTDRAARIAHADFDAESLGVELGRILLPTDSAWAKKMFVVPDGPLFGLPFAALRVAAKGQAAYVLSHAEILEEPSASVLHFLAQSPREERFSQIDIFADPVYTNEDERLIAARRQQARTTEVVMRSAEESEIAHLPRLAFSHQEAMAIAAMAGNGATLHLGFDAAPDSVREADWRSYQVAHFAAHALLNAEHPEFSGVVLSMLHKDGTPQDGVLWLDDIARLHMPVSLVVLSGCRTSEGKLVPGEGLVGLSRAFLAAGAHGVIGSLWGVEDQQTGRFMHDLYRGLLSDHLSPEAALRQAQLRTMRTAETAAPYFWAGFGFQGAPTQP